MVKFSKKRIITSRLLGEELLKARKSFNLSLKAVEHKIGIAEKYLSALENGDWEALPGEVYAKNWLRKYALFLGFDWPEVKKRFEKETEHLHLWTKGVEERFGVIQHKITVVPNILKRFLWLLLVVIIVVYLGWQIWFLLRPPRLEIVYPADNFIVHRRLVKLLGKTENHLSVMVNGELVATDKDGWFTVDMNLNKGLNIIKIEARKKYGAVSRVERRIVVEEE